MTAKASRKTIRSAKNAQHEPKELPWASNLLQADFGEHPVRWRGWDQEAFQTAKENGLPVLALFCDPAHPRTRLLNRDIFLRQDVADVLHERCIPVLVDVEERPDLARFFSSLAQMVTLKPESPFFVWCAEDRRPWFLGLGEALANEFLAAGFKTAVLRISNLWKKNRDACLAQAEMFGDGLREIERPKKAAKQKHTSDFFERALFTARLYYDYRYGGFFPGGPKNYPFPLLELLHYEYQKSQDANVLSLFTYTLEMIARGAVHDHVGGGFFKQALDDAWLVPEFSKPALENALLGKYFAAGYRMTGNKVLRKIAVETLEWVIGWLWNKDGYFYAGLDSPGGPEEEEYYLLNRSKVEQVGGTIASNDFCRMFMIMDAGNTEPSFSGRTGAPGSVPYLTQPYEEWADILGKNPEDFAAAMEMTLKKILQQRGKMRGPRRHEAVYTHQQAMIIAAVTEASQALLNQRWLDLAEDTLSFLFEHAFRPEGLAHQPLARRFRPEHMLVDYTTLVHAALVMHRATKKRFWLNRAQACHNAQRKFCLVHSAYEEWPVEIRKWTNGFQQAFDTGYPSAQGLAAVNAMDFFQTTGEKIFLDEAQAIVKGLAGHAERSRTGMEYLAIASDRMRQNQTKAGVWGETISVQQRGPVRMELRVDKTWAYPGESLRFAIQLTIAPGWYLNSHFRFQELLQVLVVEIAKHPKMKLGRIDYPMGEKMPLPNQTERYYACQGEVRIQGMIKITEKATRLWQACRLQIKFQAFDSQRIARPQTILFRLPIRLITQL